jgi:hypothetical protein
MRKLVLITLLLAAPLSMTAQRMGFAHFSGRGAGFNRPGFRRGAFYPVPFFDSFYSGDDSDVAYPAPQPMVLLMQAAPPAAAPDPAPPMQPLMIELQGDRYVQVSGDGVLPAQMIDRILAVEPAPHSAGATTAPAQLPSTILVFRNGQRQEVSAYTIVDGTLYADSDYFNSGVWKQKIALSALNLPETLAANQSRGVRFRLPSAPNEVIVGP